ncbi:hypothetical protein CEXT_480911 [Caerostris extrusa]|uniref:Uncharacterized protein n=1 Tax=Caerostris extrusa TaxID=172846 RepID=A0AAV4R9Y8_CAEEX|nr:hypothetical protein CEXT_480911 [Caerostris extrusa]
MVNGIAVSRPFLTQSAMRIDVCLSWCKDLARLKVLVETNFGGIAWEDVSSGCLRNMETDSLLMLSVDSLRVPPVKRPSPHKQPFCSTSILQEQPLPFTSLGVGCNRNSVTTPGFVQNAPGGSEVRLMVNGIAVSLSSLTHSYVNRCGTVFILV